MNKCTAAILGLTHPHSIHHLRTLGLLPRVDRIVAWDADEQAIDSLAGDDRGKIGASYNDLDEMLSREPILFAVVAVRNDLNPSVCIKALKAGVHVLSEKPMACSSEQVKGVVDAAASGGRKLGVFYTSRNRPIIEQARQLVSDGILGRITSCEARVVTSQVKFRDPSLWLFDRAQAGGGILSWLGCHFLDLMRYVAGDEVTTVSAMTATLSGEPITVEDVASVTMRFRGGAIASLQAGYQLPMSGAGYSQAAYDTYLAVRGTDGYLVWNPEERPMTLHVQSSNEAWRSAPTRKFQYEEADCEAYGGVGGVEFVNTFIDAAMGQGEPVATGHDALQIARIVEAAYESSATGRQVDLND